MFDTAMAIQAKQATQDALIRDLLVDIKRIWDREGFGSDDAESEPLYARLQKTIRQMDGAK